MILSTGRTSQYFAIVQLFQSEFQIVQLCATVLLVIASEEFRDMQDAVWNSNSLEMTWQFGMIPVSTIRIALPIRANVQ